MESQAVNKCSPEYQLLDGGTRTLGTLGMTYSYAVLGRTSLRKCLATEIWRDIGVSPTSKAGVRVSQVKGPAHGKA